MADRGEARSSARNAVVRPLSRVAGRPCARPGCPSPARATLSFRYATREAWLEKLHDEDSPASYDLCGSHADRTRPPAGWAIVDERPAEDMEPAERAPARELGDEHTVAVLAAALRAVPDRPVAPAPVVEAEAEAEAVEDVTALAGASDAPQPAPDDAVEDEPAPARIALDELDLPDDVRDGIQDALAELAAVSRRDLDGAQQIAIALDDAGDSDDPDAAHLDALDDGDLDAGDAGDLPAATPVPRPVRAARERAGDDHTGPARAW